MLVLSRRIGEQIVIAGEILVTLLAINGRQVRLGFTAPKSIRVERLELLGQSPKPIPCENAADRLAKLKARVARDQAEIARLEAAIAAQN